MTGLWFFSVVAIASYVALKLNGDEVAQSYILAFWIDLVYGVAAIYLSYHATKNLPSHYVLYVLMAVASAPLLYIYWRFRQYLYREFRWRWLEDKHDITKH